MDYEIDGVVKVRIHSTGAPRDDPTNRRLLGSLGADSRPHHHYPRDCLVGVLLVLSFRSIITDS